jgi:hypothetical protein
MSLKRKTKKGLTESRFRGAAKDPRRTRAIHEMPDVPKNSYENLHLDVEHDADKNGTSPFVSGGNQSPLRGRR